MVVLDRPRTAVIIQARLGSTRLPQKALRLLEGRPIISHVVERALRIRPSVDAVVVACPIGDVVRFAVVLPKALRLFGWAGPEDDVLGRYDAAARAVDAEVIVRVTADCPLLDPEVASAVLALWRSAAVWGPHERLLADNVGPATDGFDTEVFGRPLLEEACRGAVTAEHREHPTLWMRAQSTTTRVRYQMPGPALKLSVDTEADMERVAQLAAAAGPRATRRELFFAAERLGMVYDGRVVEVVGEL